MILFSINLECGIVAIQVVSVLFWQLRLSFSERNKINTNLISSKIYQHNFKLQSLNVLLQQISSQVAIHVPNTNKQRKPRINTYHSQAIFGVTNLTRHTVVGPLIQTKAHPFRHVAPHRPRNMVLTHGHHGTPHGRQAKDIVDPT
ncbi:hypothetical protein QQP08_017377 [Theobroma cacao]|nr:hypothetical protein QQP08_017377 [Theobroma cacao]